MKASRLVSLVLGAVLIGGLVAGPASVATGAPKATVVGTDPAGDWGSNVDPNLNGFGDATGMDLVGAEIGMADAKTVNFIIKVNNLPPGGGFPEIPRYIWDFNVDGNFTELDGKFTNYSRGTCDPTAGSCPPPRNPGTQPFFVRGECGVVEGSNVTTCKEIGVVKATFDAAAKTITVPVPLAMIKAKKGSKITPAANLFGGTVAAAPSTFLTSAAAPMDTMTVLKTFVVR